MPDPIYIPLCESTAEEVKGDIVPGRCIELPGGRRIMVGKIKKPKGLFIRIESDLPDGTVALTHFGLRPDAVEALFSLLRSEL